MRLLVFEYADSWQLFDVGAKELEDGFDHYRTSGVVTLGLYRVNADLGYAEIVPGSRLSRLKMNWNDFSFRLEFWGYRIGSYVVLTFIDDPAWLAFMFC